MNISAAKVINNIQLHKITIGILRMFNIDGRFHFSFIVKFVLNLKQINKTPDYFLYLCNKIDDVMIRAFGHPARKKNEITVRCEHSVRKHVDICIEKT